MEEIFCFLIPKSLQNTLELSDDTDSISIYVNDDKITDIDSLLAVICVRCPKLESLDIDVDCNEYIPIEKYKVKSIDFGRLYFPYLTNLTLTGIGLSQFSFSHHNMPNLESINLSHINGYIQDWNVTGLNKLTNLFIQHTFIDDPNGFEHFINSSINLQDFKSYKCRGLNKQIWCLPNAQNIELYRAECLQSLVIFYAPKLSNLCVRAACDCFHIRIFNCPKLSLQTLKQFLVCFCMHVHALWVGFFIFCFFLLKIGLR